jgi:pimeloyl-ACP methyl ester carboxylesterase
VLSGPEYLGARPPERDYDFDSDGVRLRLHEWGDPAGVPIVLCHGGWDHAHGFDLLAPFLADDFRLIAIDARGHGDSAWVDSYPYPHDVHDVMRVLRRVGRAHLLGHSRGGGLATHAACYAPELVRKLINIEGFGPGRSSAPLPGHEHQPLPGTPRSLSAYLDVQRRSERLTEWAPYASLDELVRRRKRTSPRLSDDWLRYFCFHGSRHAPDGYRWKVDPAWGFSAGPWRADWIADSWAHQHRPMLAIVADQPDVWGPLPDDLLDERFAHVRNVHRVKVPGTGHFPHMEEPKATAHLIRDFLAS